MTYEELVEALEELTRRIADDRTGIEEAAQLYQRAQRLKVLAQERLDSVAERVGLLSPEE